MEAEAVGRVTTALRIENLDDSLRAKAGLLPEDDVRSIEVTEAIVDTGAKLLSLPKGMIDRLGLERFDTQKAQTAAGIVDCNLYRAVWLTIEGRRCTVDVAEVPDGCPVLVGYIPLELLDLVVDPVGQCIIPNPAHGGQQVIDLL